MFLTQKKADCGWKYCQDFCNIFKITFHQKLYSSLKISERFETFHPFQITVFSQTFPEIFFQTHLNFFTFFLSSIEAFLLLNNDKFDQLLNWTSLLSPFCKERKKKLLVVNKIKEIPNHFPSFFLSLVFLSFLGELDTEKGLSPIDSRVNNIQQWREV